MAEEIQSGPRHGCAMADEQSDRPCRSAQRPDGGSARRPELPLLDDVIGVARAVDAQGCGPAFGIRCPFARHRRTYRSSERAERWYVSWFA